MVWDITHFYFISTLYILACTSFVNPQFVDQLDIWTIHSFLSSPFVSFILPQHPGVHAEPQVDPYAILRSSCLYLWPFANSFWHPRPRTISNNPIEHLWHHLKQQLNAYEVAPAGIHELWEWVQVEWDKIPMEVCRNLIESMPSRIGGCDKGKRCANQVCTSNKTIPSSVPYCKSYINPMAGTKLLQLGISIDTISSFVIWISHNFTFVLWAVIWLTNEIWPLWNNFFAHCIYIGHILVSGETQYWVADNPCCRCPLKCLSNLFEVISHWYILM